MSRLLRLPSKRGPLLLDLQRSTVRAEGDDHLAGARLPKRVALVAHWSPDGRVSRSVATLVRVLAADGFAVALASTAESPDPLDWSGGLPEGITVLRRPNVGYDFGSWATLLDRYPSAVGAEEVLLMNDSLVGPFAPIDQLLSRAHASRADVWGLTDTTQFGHHIQSYCLCFKQGALREAPLARFWREIRVEKSREEVILRYEIGLSRLLHREHFTLDVAIRHAAVVRGGENPTIIGWRRLLDQGFPFVKRQLLHSPQVAPDGDQVRGEIKLRYGADVDDWV